MSFFVFLEFRYNPLRNEIIGNTPNEDTINNSWLPSRSEGLDIRQRDQSRNLVVALAQLSSSMPQATSIKGARTSPVDGAKRFIYTLCKIASSRTFLVSHLPNICQLTAQRFCHGHNLAGPIRHDSRKAGASFTSTRGEEQLCNLLCCWKTPHGWFSQEETHCVLNPNTMLLEERGRRSSRKPQT